MHRLTVTEAAADLIERLKHTHGGLLFHQSGICSDGSSPMCYPHHEFQIGQHDVFVGTIAGCPFYISGAQYDLWKGTHLTIDVVKGHCNSLSVEASEGVRFLLRSQVFSSEEWSALAATNKPLRGAAPEER
jgi:hypothetical protein